MNDEFEYVTVWTGAHEGRDRDLLRPVEWEANPTVERQRYNAVQAKADMRRHRGPDKRRRRRRSVTEYQAMWARLLA